VNPNPAATFSKVHFTQLDLEHGDSLILYDSDGNRVQTLADKPHLQDFWSDDVPGRVIKVHLNACCGWEDWGFRIDRLVDGVPNAALAESKHAYDPDGSWTWTLVNPNPAAAFSKVHFTRLDLEHGDTLILYDGDGNRIQTFADKPHLRDLWSDDVPGRIVKVQLNTCCGWEDWGFRIDRLADGSPKPSLAESKHTYEPDGSWTWTLVSPNPTAAFSKVHFTRLDLEHGDTLILYDGDGNSIQTFADKPHPTRLLE